MSQAILKNPFVSAAPIKTGVGNGTLVVDLLTHFTLTQTYTLTCVSASPDTVFSVVGSLDGPVGLATAGTQFFDEDLKVFFTINQGSILFQVGDQFVFTVHQGTDVSQGNIDLYDELPQKNFGVGTEGFNAGDDNIRFTGALLRAYLFSDDILYQAATTGVAGNDVSVEYLATIPAVKGTLTRQSLAYTFRTGATANNTYTLEYVDFTPAAKAEALIQDIDYLAQVAGAAGNSLTVSYVNDGVAGSETADFDGTHIVVHIADGVSTADQIKAACDANVAIDPVIRVTVSGTGSNPQTVPVSDPTSLMNGADAIGDAGNEIVNLTGTAITITFESGVSTAAQLKTAFEAYSPTDTLIGIVIPGSTTVPQTAPVAPANFTGGADAQGVAGSEIVTVTGNAISIRLESGVSTATQVRTAFNASSPAVALASATIVGTGSAKQLAPKAAQNLDGGEDQEYSLNRAEISDTPDFFEGNASLLAKRVHAQGEFTADKHATFNEAVALNDQNPANNSGPAITNTQRAINDLIGGANSTLGKYFGQFRLTENTPTVNKRVLLSGCDVTLADNTLLGKSFNGHLTVFAGAQIDFGNGNLYAPDGTTVIGTFTTPSVPNGQFQWFGISMTSAGLGADGRVSLNIIVTPAASTAASASLAPRAGFPSSQVYVGQVVLSGIVGDINNVVQANIVQLYYDKELGSGGGGGGFVDATLADNQSSPANVTGFLMDHGINNGFAADYTITRRATTADSATIGLPDATFQANVVSLGGADGSVRAIGHLSDGSAIFGGSFINIQGAGSARLAKLNVDGTFDTTYNGNRGGSINGAVFAILTLASNAVVFGGQFTAVGAATPHRLAKLDSSGAPDAAFNSNIGNPGFDNVVDALVEQPDHKIVCGGAFSQFHSNGCGDIVRLNSDGTEDTAFTANAGTGFNGAVHGLALQADGKILAVGLFNSYNSVSVTPGFARLNTDGTLDTAFVAAVGLVGFDADVDVVWEDVANNAIFFAGAFGNFNGVTNAFACRIDSTTGLLDTAFRTNMSNGAGLDGGVTCGQIQADGKYLIGGAFSSINGNGILGYGRMNADGTVDATFDANQTVGIDAGAVIAFSTGPNFNLAMGGTFGMVNGNTSVRIFQFDSVHGADTTLREAGTFYGSYNDVTSTWEMTSPSGGGFTVPPSGFGPAGVNLTITAGGQLQYTSSLLGGTPVKSSMRFLIRGM